jgi:hypothetical protein
MAAYVHGTERSRYPRDSRHVSLRLSLQSWPCGFSLVDPLLKGMTVSRDAVYGLTDDVNFRRPCGVLAQTAVDILSIPAVSSKPERVFSGARRTISWDQCQLGSRTIERG